VKNTTTRNPTSLIFEDNLSDKNIIKYSSTSGIRMVSAVKSQMIQGKKNHIYIYIHICRERKRA
jgi:hypothetical protein